MTEKRSVPFNLRVTPTEYEWWKAAAAAAGLSLSEWLRGNANNAVAQKAGVSNLGSVLTEGGEEGRVSGLGEASLPSSGLRTATPSVNTGGLCDEAKPSSVELPSMSTEETILAEATALIRDKEGAQHRVDLLERSGRVFHPDPKPAGRKKKR